MQRARSHRPYRSLILLNAALLAALAATTFAPSADAQQPAQRVRGQYTMVSGQIQGLNPRGVYIVDAANMELIVSSWDISRRSLDFIGFRDLNTDIRNTQTRPR